MGANWRELVFKEENKMLKVEYEKIKDAGHKLVEQMESLEAELAECKKKLNEKPVADEVVGSDCKSDCGSVHSMYNP